MKRHSLVTLRLGQILVDWNGPKRCTAHLHGRIQVERAWKRLHWTLVRPFSNAWLQHKNGLSGYTAAVVGLVLVASTAAQPRRDFSSGLCSLDLPYTLVLTTTKNCQNLIVELDSLHISVWREKSVEKFRKCKQCFYLYSVFHFRSVLKIVIILALYCVRVAIYGVFSCKFCSYFRNKVKSDSKRSQDFCRCVTVNCQAGKIEEFC